ncbi:MAG: hypothetical protein GWN93_27070 [Deltaproteobacteria bacterium]|nr:hypothetical protein [Deltaproteobacteria bacterium]
MAIFEIPTTSDFADFKLRTVLEGGTYVFRIYWNSRQQRWHLSISDPDETPVLMGIPLVADTDVIGAFEIPGLPPGIIMLYDSGEKREEAGRDDLGSRHRLLYEESEAA